MSSVHPAVVRSLATRRECQDVKVDVEDICCMFIAWLDVSILVIGESCCQELWSVVADWQLVDCTHVLMVWLPTVFTVVGLCDASKVN